MHRVPKTSKTIEDAGKHREDPGEAKKPRPPASEAEKVDPDSLRSFIRSQLDIIVAKSKARKPAQEELRALFRKIDQLARSNPSLHERLEQLLDEGDFAAAKQELESFEK